MLDDLNDLANRAACRTTLPRMGPRCNRFTHVSLPTDSGPSLGHSPSVQPAQVDSPCESCTSLVPKGEWSRGMEGELSAILDHPRAPNGGRASERLRSSPSLPHPFCLLRGARRSPFCMTQGRSLVPQGLSELTSHLYKKSTMTFRSELISLQEIEDHVKGHLVCFRG